MGGGGRRTHAFRDEFIESMGLVGLIGFTGLECFNRVYKGLAEFQGTGLRVRGQPEVSKVK